MLDCLVSRQHPADAPRGRSTIWLQPAIPLRFVFDSSEPEALVSVYLKQLATSANSSSGLTVDLSVDLEAPDPAPEVPHADLKAA